MNTNTALQKAIEHLGTQAALAQALGVVQPAVSNWLRRGVPPERCLPIEQATRGAVSRHDLRPDVFGPKPTRRRA